MTSSHQPERELFSLSPEVAAEVVAEQAALCETLSTHPDLTFTDVPPALHQEVMVHVLTCQDRIHHVDGLPLDSE